jgi:hypothetical protein
LQLKISFRKGFQIYATHMDDPMKDKESSLEYYLVLKEFEHVFEELSGLTLKRDIDLSINLILGASPVFKNPYKMSTLELK